jgi:hypothetical protein
VLLNSGPSLAITISPKFAPHGYHHQAPVLVPNGTRASEIDMPAILVRRKKRIARRHCPR